MKLFKKKEEKITIDQLVRIIETISNAKRELKKEEESKK